MEYKWLNKKNNPYLIAFFNGWGMDEQIVKHLNADEYDVVMFFDYNTLDTDFDFIGTNNYGATYLVAWSMGVMIGSIFADKFLNLIGATAINGTLEPISAKYGIPPRIYDLTIKGFNESSCLKFIDNMFDTPVKLSINRTFNSQKTELCALKSYTANFDFKYNKVFVSENDKIIPTKNQCQNWGIEPNLKGGHCPFFLFKHWSELL